MLLILQWINFISLPPYKEMNILILTFRYILKKEKKKYNNVFFPSRDQVQWKPIIQYAILSNLPPPNDWVFPSIIFLQLYLRAFKVILIIYEIFLEYRDISLMLNFKEEKKNTNSVLIFFFVLALLTQKNFKNICGIPPIQDFCFCCKKCYRNLGNFQLQICRYTKSSTIRLYKTFLTNSKISSI